MSVFVIFNAVKYPVNVSKKTQALQDGDNINFTTLILPLQR